MMPAPVWEVLVKRFLWAMVFSLMAIATTQVSAHAATYDLGDITDSSNDQYGGAVGLFMPPTPFSDDIKFSLTTASFVSGNLVNIAVSIGTFSLLNDSALSATFLGNPITLDPSGNFSLAGMLAAGNYLIHVAGTTSGFLGGIYHITVAAATTPIPGALLLFVSAIGGLAGFAGMRRRGSAEA